jgi:hypothetical protein
MGRGIGGSTLSSLTARKAALDKTRRALSPDAERGAPQAPRRAQPTAQPPPQAPAADPEGQRQRMLKAGGEFLQQRGAQARGQVPRQPQPTVERVSTRPGAGDTFVDRVKELGAEKRNIETQFFRLAGREGTPRELSVFRARMEVERQLNRVPTETELLNYLARPANFPALTQPAVERSPRGAQLGAPTEGQ